MKSTASKTVQGTRDFECRVKKLALIGCGKLGEGLLAGMLGSQLISVERVEATVAHQPRADFLAEKYGVKAHTNNAQAVKGADLVLIVLKPQQVKGFLHEVKKVLRKDAVIISAAASVTTALIERELGHAARAVRAEAPRSMLPLMPDSAGPRALLSVTCRRGRLRGNGRLSAEPQRAGQRCCGPCWL